MARKFFAFCAVLIFLAGLAAAQQSQGEPSEQKRPSTIKERVKEVKENVHEFNDKKSEQQKDRPVNTLQFLGDFFTDKLPLTLDFGVEPDQNGSDIFASLQYDWKDNFSSRIKFDYANTKSIEDYHSGYKKETTKTYAFTLLPCIWYFGDADIDAKEPLWSVGAGLFYSFSKFNYYVCVPKDEGLAYSDTDAMYHTLSPAFVASVKVPFKNFFVFGSEIYLYPISYIHIDWNLKARSASVSYNNKTSTNWFTAPNINQTFWLDIFAFVRIKADFRYTRMAINDYSYLTPEGTTVSAKYQSHVFILRHGVELVLPSSNRTRKKDSHLWAGVYYEHEWKIEALGDNFSSDYKGRWVFCVGK